MEYFKNFKNILHLPIFPSTDYVFLLGSRAFDIKEYVDDVTNYWTAVLRLAEVEKVTALEYLLERFPTADENLKKAMAEANLATICKTKLEQFKKYTS